MAAAPNTLDFSSGLTKSVFSGLTGDNFNVPNLISVGVKLIFIAGIVASFIFLLIGSVQWITAGGDKEGIEKARKKITGAIVGLAISFSVFAVLRLVFVIFHVDLLGNIVIPSI